MLGLCGTAQRARNNGSIDHGYTDAIIHVFMPNEGAAIRRAETMSRDPANAGALAFKRSGDPNMGNFGDATILKTFGEVPANLDEL